MLTVSRSAAARIMPFLLVSSGTSRRRPVIVRTTPVARASASVWSMKARTRGEAGEVRVDELLRGLLRHADVLRQRERRLSVEQRVVDDLRAPPQLVRVEAARSRRTRARPCGRGCRCPAGTPRRAPRRPTGARARAARSASSRRRSARGPASATNAARISRPSGVRIGMFCRFGSLLLSRPVAATAWLNVVCTRPVAGLTSAGSASTYVPLSFWMLAPLAARGPAARASSASSSSTSCAVETTRVLPVFFVGCRFSFVEQDVGELLRRVDVELARRRVRRSAGRARRARACILRPSTAERVGVHADAGALDVGEHRNQRLLELAIDRQSRPSRFEIRVAGRARARAAGRRARRRTSRATRPAPRRAPRPSTPLPVTSSSVAGAVVGALERQAVDRVARPRRVEQVARDHRVDVGAAERRRLRARSGDRRELQVVADLRDRRDRPAPVRAARTPRARAGSACRPGPCAPAARTAPSPAPSRTTSRRRPRATADAVAGDRARRRCARPPRASPPSASTSSSDRDDARSRAARSAAVGANSATSVRNPSDENSA